MGDQRTMATIKPSKRTATNQWRKAVEVVGELEAQEKVLKEQLKAIVESLKEARAVEAAAKVDLCRLLDEEAPDLPGMGPRELPGS